MKTKIELEQNKWGIICAIISHCLDDNLLGEPSKTQAQEIVQEIFKQQGELIAQEIMQKEPEKAKEVHSLFNKFFKKGK